MSLEPYANYGLARGFGSEGATAVERSSRGGWRFERRAKRVVIVQRLQVGVVFREPAVFRVDRYRAFEVRDGFGELPALRVSDRQHVQRVIVVGVFIPDKTQIDEGIVVVAAVDGERRGIKALLEGLRR